MNAQTKLSSRGQCVIPSKVRAQMGWRAGDTLGVRTEGGRVIIEREQEDWKARLGPPITMDELLASLPKYDGPYITDAMIEETLLAEAAERYERKTRR